MTNEDNSNQVSPMCSSKENMQPVTYLERVSFALARQRETATTALVQCAEIEGILTKRKFSIEDVEKLNKMIYGY